MTPAHIALRFMPAVVLLLWAVATWCQPESEVVPVAFMVLLAVTWGAAAIEVREYREWNIRRKGRRVR